LGRPSHARNKLRAHFRKLSRFEDAQRGKDLLEKELRSMRLEPKEFVGEDRLQTVVHHFDGVENATDLLAKIGSGLLSVQNVINKLRGNVAEAHPDQIQTARTKEGKLTLSKDGIDGVVIHRAKCCEPIPGDDVVGYVTRGRGIMLHRKTCPNMVRFETDEPERLLRLEWPSDGSHYAISLKIVTLNRQGLLMDISTIFGESHTNVSAAKIRTMPNHTAEIEVSIDVRDTQHLQLVMAKISNFSDVISILRMFGRIAPKA